MHRRPKVAVLGTGDELVPPGSKPAPGEIVYSNGFALTALARSEGAEVLDLGIARDRIEDIAAACAGRANGAPTSWSPPAAPRSASTIWCSARSPSKGSILSFWRVALRPGRPMMHGRLGRHAGAGRSREIRYPPTSVRTCF